MENKKEVRQIGRGILLLLFWLPIQAIIIIILEELHLLPSYLGIALGWPADPPGGHTLFRLFDEYTELCLFCGFTYTSIGCVLLSEYGLNTGKCWKKFTLWYLAYFILTWLVFFDSGSTHLDVWFAPILWLGELELARLIELSIKKMKKQRLWS